MEPFNRECVQDLTVVRRPELLRAASSGDLPLLEKFLSKQADGGSARLPGDVVDINVEEAAAAAAALCMPAAATDGASALHVVAASGDGQGYLALARHLCGKAPELLLARDGNEDTPLHCAVRAGNAEMATLLIGEANGCDERRTMLRTTNTRGETALHDAVRIRHETGLRIVKVLMCHDKELARVVARDGTSPLYLAVSMHHSEIASELISKDPELSYSGPHGQNALHPAVLRSKKMTGLLLKSNKELTKQQDLSGSTPTHFAASADDPSLEFFLYVFMERTLEFYTLGIYFAPTKLLIRFYSCLNLPLYQLVKADADPSSAFQRDNDGQFPVHVAASAGNLVAVIILLILCPGCSGLRDSQGRTFLHVAVQKRSHNIVKFVRMRPQFNSVLNIQDSQGNTALHLAILEGHLGIFRTLMMNPHVRLNLPNHDGKTPMDLAESKAPPGFYFGMHARRRILGTLTFVNAQHGNSRRDRFKEKLVPKLDKAEESKKITDFAQIVGICSVLVATATFAAVFQLPGGLRTDDNDNAPTPSRSPAAPAPSPGYHIGTPIMAGKYAFDGFILANTLAFSCSAIATFSLVYCGMAAVDIEKRIKLVSISIALLNGAARSFCAAFAFALYLLLSPVEPATAIATATMTALVLLDAVRFLWLLFVDTVIVLNRRRGRGAAPLLKLTTAFIVNMVYLFWPYIIIFSLLGSRNNSALHSS